MAQSVVTRTRNRRPKNTRNNTSILDRAKIFFRPPMFKDRLWCRPSLIFDGGKVAGAWNWPLTSIYSWDYIHIQLHINSLCTPGVHSNNFTFYHITAYYIHPAISNPVVRIQRLAAVHEILVYLDLTEGRVSSTLNFWAVPGTTILWNSSWGA